MKDEEFLKQIYAQFEELQKKHSVEGFDESGINFEELIGESIESLEDEMFRESTKIKLGVQKIHGDAVMPNYVYPTDSGFDLCAVEEKTIPPFGRASIPTGLKFSIPEYYEIQIRPKSGLALNKGLTVLNTPGTVDEGYTGEVKVIVFNTSGEAVHIPVGMKIGQAVLCPVASGKFVTFVEVDDVEEKDRGNNGFGSTGLNI